MFMNELCVPEKACCTLQDRHADGRVMPNIDTQQDYELISLKEDKGKTTMKFKRKLDTCDPQDNKIEVGTLTCANGLKISKFSCINQESSCINLTCHHKEIKKLLVP